MKGLWAAIALILALFYSRSADAQIAFAFSGSSDVVMLLPLPCPAKSVAMDAPKEASVMEALLLRRSGEALRGCWYLDGTDIAAFWISPRTHSILSSRLPLAGFALIE